MKESFSLCEQDLISGSLTMATAPTVVYIKKSADMTSDLSFNPKKDSVTRSSSDAPTIIISPASESNMREDTVGEEKSGSHCQDLMFDLTNINCPAELLDTKERFLTWTTQHWSDTVK